MNKLDFCIIGGQKCGSSALGNYLSSLEEVNFCPIIETNYLTSNIRGQINDLDQYFRLYKNVNGLKGESSPTYAFPDKIDNVINDLHRYFPGVKLILIVRNPINRTISNINHNILLNRNYDSKDPEVIIDNDFSLVKKSMFGEVVRKYKRSFGEKFLVVTMDEIMKPEGLIKVCNFLEIENCGSLSLDKVNYTKDRKKELLIWQLYKKNWSWLRPILRSQALRRFTKSLLDQLFARNLNKKELIQATEGFKKKMTSILSEDEKIFIQELGFSYLKLRL